MSLKRNILANYIGQFYVTLVGILMVPMYLKYMGAEAYGLVGFFIMLQAWFQLLDMGLTPTMSRETARFRGGASDALSLRRLLRALEGIFIGVALLGAIAMVAGAGYLAKTWLQVQQLPLAEVQHAIVLMGVIVPLRWVCGLYRGAINGFERLVWLNAFNIAIATARFVLVIPFFIHVGTSPTKFFSYQLSVTIVETVILVAKTYRLMPLEADGQWTPWRWAPLRGVLHFSLSIAFTSSVWVLITQTDKLVLSRLLPLTEYAYFTMAVLVASGVGIISVPISVALLPRLTKLSAEGNDEGLVRLYRNATQMVAVIAIPTALVLAFFSEQVLWVWTGDPEVAAKASRILSFYALGNGFLALAAFPYYLQFAKGNLRLHLIGNAFFISILIPSLIWGTLKYGVTGAGCVWLVSNALFFMFWTPKVHMHFVKGLHRQWLMKDVAPIGVATAVGTSLAYSLMKWPQERVPLAIGILLTSLALLVIAAASSSWLRDTVSDKWRLRFAKQEGL